MVILRLFLRKVVTVCLALFISAHTGYAQHHHLPYAGGERRSIKALSPELVQDYLNGKGMGLSLAAELNHYPGPAHVLELASELNLHRRSEA
ncbi:MAG: hypothetical protein JRI22_04235 [Deltaproteobacteria bacterium]|nr:hypothetical protein [Deltaproteobacteria bacterium]